MVNAIEIRELRKVYPGVTALDGITFDVREKTVHGFLGPNGAGKSTTMRILAGIMAPTSGSAFILGHEAGHEDGEAKKCVGYLPETPPLYPEMTVESFLTFVARLHGLDSRQARTSTDDIIERTVLGNVRRRLIGNLSKGYRQRVGIAQALVSRPKILILDEPTIGLDPNAIQEIRSLILSLKEDHTVLLSTHLLHEVTLTCTDVTIIGKGKILTTGLMADVTRPLSAKSVIFAETLTWNQTNRQKLESLPFVEAVHLVTGDSPYKIKLFLREAGDMRPLIAQAIVEEKMGLLSLYGHHPHLEDIFATLTQGRAQ